MGAFDTLLRVAVLVRALRSRRPPRPYAVRGHDLGLGAAPAAPVILSYLQERTSQYRFYVQLSEQKTNFLFAVGAGLFAYAVSHLGDVRQGGLAAKALYSLGLPLLGAACFFAAAGTIERVFLPGRARASKSGALAVAYEPLGHATFATLTPTSADAFLAQLASGGTGDLARVLALELNQLARLHNQRVHVLRLIARSGLLGALALGASLALVSSPVPPTAFGAQRTVHARASDPATVVPPGRPEPARPPVGMNSTPSRGTTSR